MSRWPWSIIAPSSQNPWARWPQNVHKLIKCALQPLTGKHEISLIPLFIIVGILFLFYKLLLDFFSFLASTWLIYGILHSDVCTHQWNSANYFRFWTLSSRALPTETTHRENTRQTWRSCDTCIILNDIIGLLKGTAIISCPATFKFANKLFWTPLNPIKYFIESHPSAPTNREILTPFLLFYHVRIWIISTHITQNDSILPHISICGGLLFFSPYIW